MPFITFIISINFILSLVVQDYFLCFPDEYRRCYCIANCDEVWRVEPNTKLLNSNPDFEFLAKPRNTSWQISFPLQTLLRYNDRAGNLLLTDEDFLGKVYDPKPFL